MIDHPDESVVYSPSALFVSRLAWLRLLFADGLGSHASGGFNGVSFLAVCGEVHQFVRSISKKYRNSLIADLPFL